VDSIEWIDRSLQPRRCNSEEFFYNEMESQSGFCLPILYQPFDLTRRAHWHDRGSLFDFLLATGGEGQRLLDFGPGDGWPSLIVAPFAAEVVGVDGSPLRVQVCRANAARLGLANVRFELVEPGQPLPFPPASFAGAMAASSIEQTPDPRATLCELYRVLQPGGRLRIAYESLLPYRGGRERQVDLDQVGPKTCALTLYDRHVAEEYAQMYRLVIDAPCQETLGLFSLAQAALSWEALAIPRLEALRPRLVDVRSCRLTHPSGATLCRWLKEIGFSSAVPTHSGGWFTAQLFEQLPAASRPPDLAALDALLRPLVQIVIGLEAPLEFSGGWQPLITAVK
jgi:ubiquinone/menaquinone biosynthesis C-methylase UbiE